MNKNLIYDIGDKPRTFKEWTFYSLQQVLAVFVATVLISQICGTPTSACLVGAGFGTIIYLLFTKMKSPMFISSSGAMVSAVVGALSLGTAPNFTAVFIGGIIVFLVYAIFALLVHFIGISVINKLFPPIVIGPVTMVIGITLASFIPTYCQVGGEYNIWGIVIAFIVMAIVALVSHYGHGFVSTIPFLIGLLLGYGIATILTLTGICPLIDFSIFKGIGLFTLPDFAFFHIDFATFDWSLLPQILILFVPVTLAAMLECISDHKALSTIIGTDLTVKPGLSKIFLGDGVANCFGTFVGGLCQTSYGESVATTGFSRVASTRVIFTAGAILAFLGFFTPVQVFINTIPSSVFGGCAIILYGFIAASGLKLLIGSNVDLSRNKNLVVVSAILTTGIGGIVFRVGIVSFSSTALALIIGVILNLILKEDKKNV